MLLDLKNGSQDAFDGPVHALSVSATHVPLPKIVSESICCDWESDGGDNLSLVSQASCSAELETVFMISTETDESMPILTAYKRVDQKVKPVPGVFPDTSVSQPQIWKPGSYHKQCVLESAVRDLDLGFGLLDGF